jgi:hypothetical protein
VFLDHFSAVLHLLPQVGVNGLEHLPPVVPDGVVGGVQLQGILCQLQNPLGLFLRLENRPEVVMNVFESFTICYQDYRNRTIILSIMEHRI